MYAPMLQQGVTNELAMLNNQKIQIQREFEAFKDMATQVGPMMQVNSG